MLFAAAIVACAIGPNPQAEATEAPRNTAPWAVPPQIMIAKQEMRFTSAGATLSGTLYYPKGQRRLATAIVLHAAAVPSRDAPLYSHLKEMLPPLGVAVFVFDRRGTGRSGGGAHGKEDFDVLSNDATAAFRMLSKDPRIDPRRIGFWGLSQGGWLTLLAAKKEPRAAFAIAVSAPMEPADVQMNFATANILSIKGYPKSVVDQAIAARRAVDAYVRGKADRASAEAALHSVEQQPWFKLIYLEGNIDDPDWRQQISSDPMHSVDGTRVPTLLVYGQDDMWIPVGDTVRLLAATSARHPNITTRVIAGATHEMMLGTAPKDEMDPALLPSFAPDAPEYLALIGAWLAQRGIANAQ